MPFSFTWNASFTALPDDSENASQGASRIRDLKAAIVERMLINHSWAGDASDGLHTFVTLLNQGSKPSVASTQGALYVKGGAGAIAPYFEDDAGVESVLLREAGMIAPFAGASPPTGWLLCDGSSLLRTDYARLFTAIGTTWGSADGTHFNVPDYRGRTLIGAGTGSGLTARTIGTQNIGEETHQLTTGELASHSHTISDGGHTHTLPGYTQSDGYTAGRLAGGGNTQEVTATTSSSATGITGTNTAGSGTAHNNMQPSAVVYWIIKI